MIGLFPEGVTVHERKLQVPFKKGLARLALQAHEDLNRPIMIVPVGVSYQSLTQPRTDAFVYFGEPFSTALFFDEYLQNQNKALKDFTVYLEERLSNEIINYDSVKDQKSLNSILESQNKHLTEKNGLKFGLTNDYTFFENDQKTVDEFIKMEADNLNTEARKNELKGKTATETKAAGLNPILSFLYRIIYAVGKAIYFIPNELSKSIIKTKIKKSAFFATVRFVLLYLLFPVYTIIMALFGLIFSKLAFWAILISFPVLVYLGLCARNILVVNEIN